MSLSRVCVFVPLRKTRFPVTGRRSWPESGAPAAPVSKEEDYSALLAWNWMKGRVNTSHKGWACLYFPFPTCKQGRVVPLHQSVSCKAPHCTVTPIGWSLRQQCGQMTVEAHQHGLMSRTNAWYIIELISPGATIPCLT